MTKKQSSSKKPNKSKTKLKKQSTKKKVMKSVQVPLQPYLAKALKLPRHTGGRPSVIQLSANKIQKNRPQSKSVIRQSQMGSTAGRTNADFDAPITRKQPLAVMDYRQLLVNTKTNLVPDEFGVVNSKTFPMQNIVPSSGGKHSGRSGPV